MRLSSIVCAILSFATCVFGQTLKVPDTRVVCGTNNYIVFQPTNTTLNAVLAWLDENWNNLTNTVAMKSDLNAAIADLNQTYLTISNFNAYVNALAAGASTGANAFVSSGTTNFTIPAGATLLKMYAWGGGGAGRTGGAISEGGAGGFSYGELIVTGDVSMGTGYVWSNATITATIAASSTNGGNHSLVSWTTGTVTTVCLVAGGGGEGGYGSPNPASYPGWPAGSFLSLGNGSAGGGTNGTAGSGASGSGARSIAWSLSGGGGAGGTQSASGSGGAGAVSGGSFRNSGNGGAGSAYGKGASGSGGMTGGYPSKTITATGGEGGSGYKGGGGGGSASIVWADSVFEAAAGGGGGGSGYLGPVTNGYLQAGTGRMPPQTSASIYALYGGGNKAYGGSGAQGYGGLVVIVIE